MALQGRLIEILGLNVLEPTPKMLEVNPRVESVDLNGCLGWAVEWVEEEAKYRVETFQGYDLYVKEENLREYHTLPTRDGGFDVAWPATGLEEYFGEFAQSVSDALINQYYCMVQMLQVKEQAKAALTKAYVQSDWSRIMPEFEPDFLGNGSLGKINWLPQDPSLEEDDGLSRADAILSYIAGLLAPYTPMLGFASGSRSAGLLRMPFEDEDEEVSLTRGVDEDGIAVSGREIEGCLQFTKLRKIGLIYFLHGDGGTLRLDFKDPDKLPVEIPIEQGRVFIFRHDLLQFSYTPGGSKALALQAWIFREERPGECEILPRAASEIESWDMSKVPSPPTYGNSNETVDCMSIAVCSPGGCHYAEDYWQVMCHGVDGINMIGYDRWDQDIYYDPDPHPAPGKMYCNHIGFVPAGTWNLFDPEYFDFSQEEAEITDPSARKLLETAWDCLFRSGWTWDKLRDTNMAIGQGGGMMDGFQAHFLSQFPSQAALSNHIRADSSLLASYKLGLRGPQFLIDTACSSALSALIVMHSYMRPQMPGQTKNNFTGQCPYGLALGSNGFASPLAMMGLAGAGMLSHQGRSFTFDGSADGYQRGEGSSAMHFQVSKKEELSRFMILKGSCSNQDGKSASLTAPNGPSQTACCRISMREAGNDGFNTLVHEMHGTGTPLGDPIETGALQNVVINGPDGKTRKKPVLKTSSKTNVGHGEPLAGLNGIIKCTLMMKFQLAAPNCHLRILNPNLDCTGYPVIFPDDRIETGEFEGFCGVSSFGFSGCNARADIWGMATAGHRQAFPIGYDLGTNRHERLGERKFLHAGSSKVSSSSIGAKKLETFDGVFGAGLLNEESVLSLSGSWNAWTTMDTMDQVPEVKGDAFLYQMGFRIGDTLVEEFCIHVDGYADNMIFPASKAAGKDTLVLGPGTAPKDYNWRVDGRVDGAEPGAIYVVSLWWYAETNRKRVSWELVSENLKFSWPLSSFTHRYGVKGTWTSWYAQDLEVTSEGCYETVFRIGNTGSEEFQLVRDCDESQLIYPTESTVNKKSVSVRGPDGNGKGKLWTVEGKTGDPVRLQLKVTNGEIVVTIHLKSGAERTWKNLPPGVVGSYYLLDFDGRCEQLQQSKDDPRVQKALITTWGDEGYHFQIVIDKDPSQAIYPELSGALASGLSSALGPDAFGQGQFWSILEPEGAKVEITYDPTQADRRRVVTWRITNSSQLLRDDTPIGLHRED